MLNLYDCTSDKLLQQFYNEHNLNTLEEKIEYLKFELKNSFTKLNYENKYDELSDLEDLVLSRVWFYNKKI